MIHLTFDGCEWLKTLGSIKSVCMIQAEKCEKKSHTTTEAIFSGNLCACRLKDVLLCVRRENYRKGFFPIANASSESWQCVSEKPSHSQSLL